MTKATSTPYSAGPTPQELAQLSHLFAEKRYADVTDAALDMTARFPLCGIAWKALGVGLRMTGRRCEESLGAMQQAVALLPDDAEAHSNLGLHLQETGRLIEAEASCRRALQLNPDYAEAHFNLGISLQEQGHLAEAEECYRRAVQARPEYAEAHYNLGVALQEANRPDEAEASYRRALQIKPDSSGAHNNLANVLIGQGRLVEAAAAFQRALQIKPDFAEAHSNLIFMLDLIEDRTMEEHQAERRRWYEQHGRKHADSIPAHGNSPEPERKLRIGFVSADFRMHSAYVAFSPIILHLDRNAFEVVCYSGVKLEDDATARLRQAAQEWRSTLGMSDDALAEQIRRDRIDILVDLSGHSAGNRLLTFARKPAPVQVTGWGHATGTGLATMDYFLTDATMVRQEERRLYAEEVVNLSCWGPYSPPEYAPAVSPLPALEGKAFTFGCVNRIEKISDRVIRLWSQILAELPAARLLIKGAGLESHDPRLQFLNKLGEAGIEAERVTLLGLSPHAEHLKIFHEVDLGLDPLPHAGGISTADALWMGVPVVTLHGQTVSSRITSSFLTVLGMTEWIAHSDEEYVRIAVNAARNLPRLARLRAKIRSKMAASPLGDTQRYTREVETAFRSMWRRWCTANTRTSKKIKR